MACHLQFPNFQEDSKLQDLIDAYGQGEYRKIIAVDIGMNKVFEGLFDYITINGYTLSASERRNGAYKECHCVRFVITCN